MKFRRTTVSPAEMTGHLSDFEPTFSCDIGKAEVAAKVYTGGHPADVTSVALLLQGWMAKPQSLHPFATELVSATQGLAAIVLQQPRLPRPNIRKDIGTHIREANPMSIRQLRARSAQVVGQAACHIFGVDSLSIISHSLGTVDAAQLYKNEPSFDISRLTALAPSGFFRRRDIVPVALRAKSSACGGTGNMKDKLRNYPVQIPSEGLYALTAHIAPTLKQMKQNGTSLYGIDFANDKLMGQRDLSHAFTDGYHIIDEGCACHNAPSHGSEASRIVETIQDAWTNVQYPDPQPGYAAVPRQPSFPNILNIYKGARSFASRQLPA
ncbi:MAG TPA: hypothetical protein VF575_00255 [Candidatus Saccharimonadales bacterium]|jgi:hypothetical protein